ncbi:hypothetical protein [Sphingomonas sp. S6]|jgi:hypothetical protein|uniref:hypothetical protein n=1 Tax=Sphingomonas sp. S6 TaxID=3368600 RepID=UPI000F988C21|nr:hypothetical protein [uncultured Sphingomonas sp.]RTL17445.1 MAG: hypothetical protein EKK50_09355 [Sphingomonadaceae bacterium]
MIVYADVYADKTIASFDRYVLRSASKETARVTMETILGEVGKIEIENAPDQAASFLKGVADDTPVMISPGVEARFI